MNRHTRLAAVVSDWKRALLGAAIIGAAAAGVIWVLLGSSKGQPDQAELRIEKIFQDTKTIAGQPVEFPRHRSQFTAVLVELAPGAQTGRHRHLAPALVYVIQGTLTLSVDGHGSRTFRAGQGYVAALNVWHNSANHERTAAKQLVIYLGAHGQKLEEWSFEDLDPVRTLIELGVI